MQCTMVFYEIDDFLKSFLRLEMKELFNHTVVRKFILWQHITLCYIQEGHWILKWGYNLRLNHVNLSSDDVLLRPCFTKKKNVTQQKFSIDVTNAILLCNGYWVIFTGFSKDTQAKVHKKVQSFYLEKTNQKLQQIHTSVLYISSPNFYLPVIENHASLFCMSNAPLIYFRIWQKKEHKQNRFVTRLSDRMWTDCMYT
jgi:hypothetical protein